jgi:glycosyltransferase involved in cell wall biosynthesis
MPVERGQDGGSVQDRPSLTVVMPLKHYHPDFLQQALDSLLAQDRPTWRLLIVDDTPRVEKPDREPLQRVLRDMLTDPRVRLIVNQGRMLAGAINTGMRAAETEFVALLLGDDRWSPTAVRVLHDYIGRFPDVDFFHSSRRWIDERNVPIGPVHPSREHFTREDFLRGSPVKHLLCWRRAKGLAVGGLDESLNNVGPDDYDFPWTMFDAGATFQAVTECLYDNRDHREAYRLTTHLPLSVHQREIGRILKKHGVSWPSRVRQLARARQGYLRQCLYRNSLDRWIKERLGTDARKGWRER